MEPSTAISTLTPSSTTSSSIRQAMDIVFDIPELADAILDFLSPLNITRLRLTSKSLHQRCHHRFIMVLDSRREFNDDEEQEIIFTLPRRTKTSLDQPQPLPDPRGADKMRLVLRNQRHRNGILTTTGHNLLQTRADRIQVLDLELEATVKSWGRRLLREAHSLSWDDSSKMRIQRATFRISLDTKLDESWETILLGPRESISGGVGLTSASEVNTTGFSATTLRTRTDTLPPSRTGTRSPLFQALESFSIEVLDSFSRAQCLAGIPKALHCAGQLGIITNTLRSLSLVSTNTSQQLVWSELKECLVSCKVLESLSIVKLRLISEREIPGFKSGGESSDGDDDDSDSWNDKTVLQTLQSSKTTAPKSKPWADINLREVTVMTVLMTNLVRAEFVATVCSKVESLRMVSLDQLICHNILEENRDYWIDSSSGHRIYPHPRLLFPRLQRIQLDRFIILAEVDRMISWSRDYGIQLAGICHLGRRYITILERLSEPSTSTPTPVEKVGEETTAATIHPLPPPPPTALQGTPVATMDSESTVIDVVKSTIRPVVELDRLDVIYSVPASALQQPQMRTLMQSFTGVPFASSSLSCCQSLRVLELPNAPLTLLAQYLKSSLQDEHRGTMDKAEYARRTNYSDSTAEPGDIWLDLLTSERLLHYIPIIKTLTRLCLCPRTGHDRGDQRWGLPWINKILSEMPMLTEFVLGYPIRDLSLFRGMGRVRLQDLGRRPTPCHEQQVQEYEGAEDSSDHGQEWWRDERPFLEHIDITRSRRASMSTLEFKRHLYRQFRFLKSLDVGLS